MNSVLSGFVNRRFFTIIAGLIGAFTTLSIGGCDSGNQSRTQFASKAALLPCPPFEPCFTGGAKLDSLTSDFITSGLDIPEDISACYLEFLNLNRFQTQGLDHYAFLDMLLARFPRFVALTLVTEPAAESCATTIDSVTESWSLSRVRILPDYGRLGKRFGIPQGCFAGYLLDSAHTVRFYNDRVVSANYLRQLAEKFGGAPVDSLREQEDAWETLFAVGRLLPDLELIPLQADSGLSLCEAASQPGICALFSAACTECEIRNFLRDIRRIEPQMSERYAVNRLCVFEEDLSLDRLESFVAEYALTTPTYVVPRLARGQSALGAQADHILVISWDGDGRIEQSEDFDSYFRRALLSGR